MNFVGVSVEVRNLEKSTFHIIICMVGDRVEEAKRYIYILIYFNKNKK